MTTVDFFSYPCAIPDSYLNKGGVLLRNEKQKKHKKFRDAVNSTALNNIKDVCSDCGAVLPDADSTLCEKCKKARQEKAKAWLATAGKVAGAVAAVAGAIYAVSRSLDDDDTGVKDSPFTDDLREKGKYKVIFDGEEQDEVFDTEEDAEEYALYLRSCTRTGAETLHWSNPGDYDYDEDTFEDTGYEIVQDD